MDFLPQAFRNLIDDLARLPGVGRKTAQRLAFHIMRRSAEEAGQLAAAIVAAKAGIKPCSLCGSYADTDLCPICSAPNRNPKIICVVEKPVDILAIERSGYYKGLYHVLGGAISPLDGITPEQLNIQHLLQRVNGSDCEVILSTGTSTEGDHTALYLTRILKENGAKVTRMARGIPAGSDIEYVDEVTLYRALEGRTEL